MFTNCLLYSPMISHSCKYNMQIAPLELHNILFYTCSFTGLSSGFSCFSGSNPDTYLCISSNVTYHHCVNMTYNHEFLCEVKFKVSCVQKPNPNLKVVSTKQNTSIKPVKSLIENNSNPLTSIVIGKERICTGFTEVRVGSYQSSVIIRLFDIFLIPHCAQNR